MPLNSAQFYIKGLLDDLPIPGNTGNLRAFITPLSPDDNDEGQPTAFIWPTKMDEGRDLPGAMPRNNGTKGSGGFKGLRYGLDIYLVYPSADEEPGTDSAFPGVIDAVMWVLRTVPNPVVVTDPLDGFQSQLANTGEKMSSELVAPQALAAQRWSWYAALITLPLLEVIQA